MSPIIMKLDDNNNDFFRPRYSVKLEKVTILLIDDIKTNDEKKVNIEVF